MVLNWFEGLRWWVSGRFFYVFCACLLCLFISAAYINFSAVEVNNVLSNHLSQYINLSSKKSFQNGSDPGRYPQFWEVFSPSVRRECLDQLPKRGDAKKNVVDDDDAFLKTEEAREYKKILFWTFAYGISNFVFGFGHKPFEKACCKEQRCYLTAQRSYLPISEFDALIFHFRSLKTSPLPSNRSEHQRWIFYEKESPAYSFDDPAKYNGIFNWTMTYRKDSDIFHPYGYVLPNEMVVGGNQTTKQKVPKTRNHNKKYFKNRPVKKVRNKNNIIAAWMVSHCRTLSNREYYVKELQKYIGVDVFGDCGKLKCPANERKACYEMLERNYKFYMSFENSLCREYVTEKFFNILQYDLIPVVFGYGNYQLIAPPHSYINVFNFKNMEELAKYLIYLDRNDTAYYEYFRWKDNYKVISSHWMATAIGFCKLCERLHKDTAKKTYQNISKWFYDDAKCKRIRPPTLIEQMFNVVLA